jgi:hypothetical protein
LCQEGAPEEVLDPGRNLKVVEHLGGKTCAEEGTEITKSLRVLWKLCQEGIEQVHRVHIRTLF